MKNTFHKKFAVLCLSAVMSLGLCFGVSGLSPVGAASSTKYDVAEIVDSYIVDTTVTVSDTPDATKTVFPKVINIDSVSATATNVKYPDGYERNVGDEFVLDQLGTYTLTYKTANNLYYYDTFRVFDRFTDITGDGYIETYENGGEIAGVRAVMEPGTIMKFNKVIDLNNFDEDTGCVDLFTARFNVGNTETKFVSFTQILIEDVNNPDVFVKMNLETYANNQIYFRASTKELPEAGLLPNSTFGETLSGNKKALTTYIDGVRYKNYFGWAGRWSLGANANYIIRYNPSTQEFFREDPNKPHNNSEIFLDLDNVDAYDQGARFFEGFPSKAVKITVTGQDWASAFNLEFSQIGDSKGADLVALNANGVDDISAPQITLNSTATEAGTVYGKFGTKFYVPTSSVVDANDASNVSVKAYKNYVKESKVYVPFETDGTLLLSEETVYTLEYTSYDRYGNLAVETLNVVPKKTTEITGFDQIIDSNLRLGVNKISLVTGEKCNANVYELLESINDNNALTLTVKVEHAGSVVFDKTFNSKDLAGENVKFDFLPLSVGDYVVTYTLKDNVEEASFTYTVECVSQNKINFLSDPFTYQVYMYGMEYDVSAHVAYQFGSQLDEQATTVEYSYDDGATWTTVLGKTVTIGADANGEVPIDRTINNVKFRYTSGDVVQETVSKPIIDVRKDITRPLHLVANRAQGITGNVDYSKYLLTDGFDISTNAQHQYIFNPQATAGSATLKLANPVTFDKKGEFYVSFKTYTEFNQFNKLTLTLVDAYDTTNKLSIYYEIVQGETLVYMDGVRKAAVADFPLFSTTEGVNTSTFDFTYNVKNERVSSCGKQFVVDFHPTNNLYYAEITLGGIFGNNAGICIPDISNVTLSDSAVVDNRAPIIYYQSSAGTYALGTQLPIYAPTATDFVSPFIYDGYAKVKVTVNNKAVTSIEGVVLDGEHNDPTKTYNIAITDPLIYKVTYIVKDKAGKEDSSATYTILGSDMVDPVITLGYDFNENTIHNVTLGKPFSIDYTVTDDQSPSENCLARVIIINDLTSREIYAVEPMEYAESSDDYALITDTCTITVKGMYTVYVYAADEAGNTVYAKYKLNVQ